VPLKRAQSVSSVAELHRTWREPLLPDAVVSKDMGPLTYTENVWRRRLEPAGFHVLQEEDSEALFSRPLNEEDRPGRHVC
jgi:hypothetical protein